MNGRRTSTLLATIALAIAAILCASDASACSSSSPKVETAKSCCARKQRPTHDCCKAAGRSTAKAPAAAVEADLDAAPCVCDRGRPDAPLDTDEGRIPPRVESHFGFVASYAVPADRSATDVAVGRLMTVPPDGSSIYLRSSRLLL